MMEFDRVVTITDIQNTVDGEECTQVITRGYLRGTSRAYRLTFTELIDGENECKTRIDVKPDGTVNLMRTGAYNSEMIFEQGKRHNTLYVTPFGEFMIGIFAKIVENSMTADGGTIALHYTIDFYGGLAAEKKLIIEVGEGKTPKKRQVRKEKSTENADTPNPYEQQS